MKAYVVTLIDLSGETPNVKVFTDKESAEKLFLSHVAKYTETEIPGLNSGEDDVASNNPNLLFAVEAILGGEWEGAPMWVTDEADYSESIYLISIAGAEVRKS